MDQIIAKIYHQSQCMKRFALVAINRLTSAGLAARDVVALDSRLSAVYSQKAVRKAMSAFSSETISLSSVHVQAGGHIAWFKGTGDSLRETHRYLADITTHQTVFALMQIARAQAGPTHIEISTTPDGLECLIMIRSTKYIDGLAVGGRAGMECSVGMNTAGGSTILMAISESSVASIPGKTVVRRRMVPSAG